MQQIHAFLGKISQIAVWIGGAALLGSAHDWDSGGIERFKGFGSSFCDGGGTIVQEEKLNDTPGFYAGYYGTENMLNQNHEIDMIYFQDDTLAIGGLSWCQRKGIRVPEDIGIAGLPAYPMDYWGQLVSPIRWRRIREESEAMGGGPTLLSERPADGSPSAGA